MAVVEQSSPPEQHPSSTIQTAGGVRRLARLAHWLGIGLRWAGWLLRPVTYAVALYSVLFLLQVIRITPQLTGSQPQASELQLQLEPEPMFGNYDVSVAGRGEPNQIVEIGVNNRLLETAFIGPDGRFSLPINVPVQTNRIWGKLRDPVSGEVIAEQAINFELPYGSVIPSVDFAAGLGETGMLWLAGRATPWTRIDLFDEQGVILASPSTDEAGVYDALVQLDGPAPTQIQARVAEADWTSSEPVIISPVADGQFPLSRQAEIDLNPTQPSLHLKVTLPVAHPYFQSLAQGYLTPGQFVAGTFGYLSDDYAIDYTATVQIGAETNSPPSGTVDITGRWAYPLSEFVLSSNYSSGIGFWPLLTASDSLTLRFNRGVGLAWFAGQMPLTMDGRSAAWRGPLEGGDPFQLVRIGLQLPAGAVARRPAEVVERQRSEEEENEKQRQQQLEREQKMREFLRGFEARSPTNITFMTWRTLTLLIPYLAMLWLARRRNFGRRAAWPAVAAAVVVLAIWRNWNYLYYLFLEGPGRWLQQAITPVRFLLGAYGSEQENILLYSAPENTFWLLFVAFMALAPHYLPFVEQRLSWRPALPERRRSILRLLWAGGRLALGASSLSLLAVASYWFFRYRFSLEAQEALASQLEQVLRLPFDQANQWISWLTAGPVFAALLALLLLIALLAWSLPAGLFGLGLLAVTLRAGAVAAGSEWGMPLQMEGLTAQLLRIPWWAVTGFAMLSAYPLTLRSLRRLAPKELMERPGWRPAWLALVLVLAAFGLPYLPARWALLAGGLIIFAALGWLALAGLRELDPVRQLSGRVGKGWLFALGLLAAGVAVVWPIQAAGQELGFRHLSSLMSQLDDLFVFILALALVLLLRKEALQQPEGQFLLGKPVLEAAIVLFAAFLINSSTTWLFIPVPFLVGLLVAKFLLFRPYEDVEDRKEALIESTANRKHMIQDILHKRAAHSRFENIRKALDKKLDSAELAPDEYQAKLESYRQHFKDKLALEEEGHEHSSKETAFAVGETSVWRNTTAMLRAGALLATIPLLIALYEYLPSSRVSYPYPLANLVVFLISATASWLLYAFFFGYYYVHLRGNSGLSKGIYLFAGLIVPFAVYRLLSAQTLGEMRYFIIWTTQIFLFCSILGLLTVEYRLLLGHGFHPRDLLAVHNLPVLSVYASSVVAAVIPIVLAIVTDRLGDVVKFFLETVLPRVPGGGP